jgi:hypothetical protein
VFTLLVNERPHTSLVISAEKTTGLP